MLIQDFPLINTVILTNIYYEFELMVITELLGLPPSSPDAAIFTNASKVTPPSSTGKQTSTAQQSENDSYGNMIRPPMIIDMMVVALAIVLIAIPTRVISIYT